MDIKIGKGVKGGLIKYSSAVVANSYCISYSHKSSNANTVNIVHKPTYLKCIRIA